MKAYPPSPAFLMSVLLAAAGCAEFDVCVAPAANVASLPARLSETGLRQRDGGLAPGVVAYTPAFALWSDGAEKHRYVRLPDAQQIDTSTVDDWRFPVGTRFWKEFIRDGVPVETRLLVKTGPADHEWAAGAYVFDDGGVDATFAEGGAVDVRGTAHDAPAASLCVGCHGGRSSFVLGFSALQLGNVAPGGFDLAAAADAGMFSSPVRTMTVPGTEEQRAALGYLHANCSHCHNTQRPMTMGPRCFDPQNELDMFLRADELDTVAATAPYRTLFPNVIRKGDPANSTLFQLVSRRQPKGAFGPQQMPPLATDVVDEAAVETLRRWIQAP